MPPPLRIDLPGYAFEMILVEGGAFRMGSQKDTEGAYEDEYPDHDVTVPDFYLGRYPVTRALWRAVAQAAPEFDLDPDPSNFKGDERPVENISWDDIKEKFLPALEKITGRPFRLPSEAEWEYAARGGKHHAESYAYAGSDKLREVGWYDANSGNETQPVGLLYTNALGLYDMSGNVWEWCEDDWHGNYEKAPIDGSAWVDHPERGDYRVRRGGGSWPGPQYCRVASRFHGHPAHRFVSYGFRLASPFQSG